jgi:predicted enzyme related to lactoylglutathione lyase
MPARFEESSRGFVAVVVSYAGGEFMKEEETSLTAGTIGWVDLTVEDALSLRDFYAAVVGWKPQEVDMGGYSDFNMTTGDGTPRAGICHAARRNEGIPPVWMIYIHVDDLDESLDSCRAAGGDVVGEIRTMGEAGRYAFIRDPAGAVCALFEPPRQQETPSRA